MSRDQWVGWEVNKANLRDLIAATSIVILLKLDSIRRFFGLYSISQEICTWLLLCCGYTLTDFPISIRLTSLALWQSNDCPSASKATLMNMDKYFMWIHYERLHNHNKAKHNKTVCIFLGIYCMTMTFDGWPRKSVGQLFYTRLSFVHHWKASGEFKLEL